jgi:sec-independent protein translocase protein TatA
MGIGGISVWQLLIILAIVVMLFGTKRLRSLGSDLGAAVKGFRNTMSTEESAAEEEEADAEAGQLKEQAEDNK